MKRSLVILWSAVALMGAGLMVWSASDVRMGRTCLQSLSWALDPILRAAEVLPAWCFKFLKIDYWIFLLLPILSLPLRTRSTDRRAKAKAWLLLCACAAAYAAESLYLNQMIPRALVYVTLSAFLALALGLFSRKDNPKESRSLTAHHLALATAILLTAVFLLYRLDRCREFIWCGNAPWWTMKVLEGYSIPGFWNASGSLEYVKSGSVNAYRSPLYLGLSIVAAKAFGSYLISSRLVSVFFSLLALPLSYVLYREVLGRPAARLSVLLAACWPLMFMWGRFDTHVILLPFVFLLVAWLLFRSARDGKILAAMAAGSLIALCWHIGYLYAPSKLVPFACSGFFLLGLLRSQVSWKRSLLAIVLLLLSIATFLYPVTLHHENLLGELMETGTPPVPLPASIPDPLRPYAMVFFKIFHPWLKTNALDLAEAFFNSACGESLQGDGPLCHILIMPLVLPGLCILLMRNFPQNAILLLPWMAFSILPGLMRCPLVPSRIFNFVLLFPLLSAFCLVEWDRWIEFPRKHLVTVPAILGLFVTLCLMTLVDVVHDPLRRKQGEEIQHFIDAARLGFNKLDQTLVCIECPPHREFGEFPSHLEIERLSLLLKDMTGRTSSEARMRVLLRDDRQRLLDIAIKTTGKERGWIFFPESWTGTSDKESPDDARFLLPICHYGILESEKGFPCLAFPREFRFHPSVAFIHEPLVIYSDLAELVKDLSVSQDIALFVMATEENQEILRKMNVEFESLPGNDYIMATVRKSAQE